MHITLPHECHGLKLVHNSAADSSVLDQLPELVPFLEDAKPEVRQMAVNALAEYSINADAHAVLRDTEVVVKLKRCLGDIAAIQSAALATYVNLAADELLARQMVMADITTNVTNMIRGEETTLQEQVRLASLSLSLYVGIFVWSRMLIRRLPAPLFAGARRARAAKHDPHRGN